MLCQKERSLEVEVFRKLSVDHVIEGGEVVDHLR